MLDSGSNAFWLALLVLCAGCSAAAKDAGAGVGQPPNATAHDVSPAVPDSQASDNRTISAPLPTTAPLTLPDRGSDGPATEKPSSTRPRIGALAERAYIYKKPQRKGLALGYVRMGTSAPLLSDQPISREGCPRGWYAVAPRGYVCLDQDATLDLEDPYFKALASVTPRDDVWPYRYAFSSGAPMYSRIPTREEQEKAERDFGPIKPFVSLGEWSKGHEELIVDEPIVATDPVPPLFAGGKRTVYGGPYHPARLVWRVIPNGSMLAYAKAFEAEGRVWLLTPDLMLVPAERMRAMRRSSFHGVNVGEGGMQLPLAWNRSFSPKPKYRREADGSFVETGATLGPKSPIEIGEDRIVEGKKAFLGVRGEPGIWVAESDVTVTRQRSSLPRGVSSGEKWLEVRIVPGTMTAYEGLTPVYATLFSPGKGGAPIPGFDPYVHSMTKTGFFPIEWKDFVSTMSPDKKWPPTSLWISDVPYVQFLRAPLAMHVSYWHEDFGKPKSAECVNVAPEDGRILFGWTDPPLPEGWGGIRPGDGNGKSTPVVITAM